MPDRHGEFLDPNLGKAHRSQAADRPVAGACLGLGPREALADFGGEILGYPKGKFVLKRIGAQRGDLRVRIPRRLGEDGKGGRGKEAGKKDTHEAGV